MYIYRRLGGVVDPNWEIGFGSVAVRCVAITLRCVAIALRCDAKLCVRVKRRDSAGWCFKLAGVPGRAGPGRVTPPFQECKSKEKQ